MKKEPGCPRCNGLVVKDDLDCWNDDWERVPIPAIKCVNCGWYCYPMHNEKDTIWNSNKPMNQQEIADLLGITRKSVMLIEKKAFEKMKNVGIDADKHVKEF